MCSSKSNQPADVAKINGRAVLQPKSNQLPPTLEEDPRTLLDPMKKKKKKKPLSTQDAHKAAAIGGLLDDNATTGGGGSTRKPTSPPTQVIKLGSDPRSKIDASTVKKPSSISKIIRPGGSVAAAAAAARREEVALRKMKIAHYGRLMANPSGPKSTTGHNHNKGDSPKKHDSCGSSATPKQVERRCSFITPTSDPIYIAYHDQEWGVSVHDDRMLFEMLVLTSAQVGSDWTSVLKKRQQFREAFSGFEAETVAKFSEKDITSASTMYGIDMTQVRAAVDNSKRILQVKEEYGSLDNYLWGYVNHKAVCSGYKSWQKVPGKSSKSEGISKDMVRRGFRHVGPTVIHSFMQAVGLTNDHLITCPRHLQLQLTTTNL